MRNSMKMLAARSRSESNNARGYRQEMGEPVYYPRNDMNYRMEGPENARNDGRMEMYGYGNRGATGAYNRYEMNSPTSWEYTRTDTANGAYSDMEARRRYRRYDNGRFAPKNEMEMRGEGGEMHHPFGPPPVYEGGADMNRIGFSANRGEFRQDYPNNASYEPRNEMEHSSSMKQHGGAKGSVMKRMDFEMAKEWMEGLENEDGTKGPHWTYDQAKQLVQQNNLALDPVEFWCVINAIYSDDVAVAKKHGVNKPDYYVDRAKAWLTDKDAVEGKAAAYFCYIVK